jgi:thiamine transport system ATP-binding protein
VTLLFQEHNLFPHLSVAQNVGLGRRADLRLGAEDRAAVETALGSVGLAGVRGAAARAAFGGRAPAGGAGAGALAGRPVLMLDEPFAALGPALRGEMLELVARLRAETGATLLMVTHEPRDAERIASATVLVADGVASGPFETRALFAAPPPALRAYLGT